MAQENGTIKFKVPNDVAKIMKQWGGHKVRLAAARGALPMSGPNLVTVLFIFYHGENEELKNEAFNTLKELSSGILKSVCTQAEIHPEILDLLARLHCHNMEVMEPLLTNKMVGLKTLMYVAEHASGDVLDLVASNDVMIRKAQALRTILINNPNADKALKIRLGWREEVVIPEPEKDEEAPSQVADSPEEEEENEGLSEGEIEEFDDETLSKYQRLLDMPVADKIKLALTGDKEWRSLLIRESNKLVNTAVLKNPRITDPEVLAVAKNRTSSEELIRLILLNKDWVKKYDMKKALVEHPRTPLQQAMRLMGFLSEKDIKELAKSRNVSQAIVNNARRLVMTKDKKR